MNMPMNEERNRPTSRDAADAIARAAIARVDPVRMITDALSLEDDRLIAG